MFIKNYSIKNKKMKHVTLTPEVLSLDGYDIPLSRPPVISSGVDEQWLYSNFTSPKEWDFAKAKAREAGYDDVAYRGEFFYFIYKGEGFCDEPSREVARSELLADMPKLQEYTKFLGIDLEEPNLNEDLKEKIDSLNLNELETKIRKTGFEGRRSAVFGPSGVIVAMTDQYSVNIGY